MTNSIRAIVASGVLLIVAATSGPARTSARQDGGQAPRDRGQTATMLQDGTILLLGGERTPGVAAVYDPRTRTTRAIGRLLTPRAWHTATVLPDGTVLIVGGVDRTDAVVPTVERFDPASQAFTTVGDTSLTPRAHHTATLLTDGRILFSGGDVSGGPAAELWDSASNAVEALAGSHVERWDGEARLLPDGRVRISGGRDRGRERTPPANMFDPSTTGFVEESELGSLGGRGSGRPGTVSPSGVVAVSPPDGATDVPTSARVAIRFSDPLVVPSLSAQFAAIVDGSELALSATFVQAEGGMLAFLTPASPLPPGVRFRVGVRGGRTATGARVEAFASEFTTANEPDRPTEPATETEVATTDRRRGLDSPWRKLPALQARAGVTALVGQVLLQNGQPLAHVTLAVGSRRTRTDRTGRFLLELGSMSSGWPVLLIDGTTANRGHDTYGIFEVAAQIVGKKTASLPYTIWMPRIDTANAVRIPSPTREPMVITTPRIPGLELHLPANTTIRDRDGRIVREVSLTPIPVDQPPFPLPAGVETPVYFTAQPGGAYIHTAGYGPKGASLVYPSGPRLHPGDEVNFWHYDPERKGWHVYGVGQVTPDGRQVRPNPRVAIYEFTGAMVGAPWSPGPPKGNGPAGADPVDLSTGQFVMEKTDLVVQDVIPLVLTRTYVSGDSGARPFGIGSTFPYAMFLWSANQYTEVDLILPDGKRIHYVRTSGGTGFVDAVFEHTASPTTFYKSVIVWNGNGWDLTLKDGTVYVFGNEAPLQAVRDRFGNTVTLTWSTTNFFGSGTGKIVKVTSPTGRTLEFTYDGSNRITQAKDNISRTVGYEYDGSGRLWKVTDARGGVTEYTYDIAHRMLTVEDPRNITYLTNDYDTNGRVEAQTQADTGVYEFVYTLNGSQVTQTDVTNPRGFVRRVTFNGDRFMTSDTHALGEAIEQATSYTRLTSSNLVETVTDALGRVTRYGYDSQGNVTSVSELDGTADEITTTFAYDGTYNLLTSTTDSLNHTTTIAYDTQGRILSSTDALSHATTFTTNPAGQVLTATTALSKTTTFGYDLGDLTSVQTPLGHTQTLFVDAAGRVVRITDATGGVTRFEYNAQDQITKTIDPRGGETTFTYDGNGSLLALTDARAKTRTWTYDDMDRVATRTDPLSRDESFEYDLNGNLTKWTDRKGQVTTYQYDALDRQTFVGFGTTGAPPSYNSTITTTYDAGDRAMEIVDSVAGTIERTYDLLDRLTEEVTPEGTVSYTYDDAGRRASMIVAGQNVVSYTYDNADRLTGVTRGTASVTIAYDSADQRTSLTLPNGIVVEYAYDDDSRLTGLTYKQGMSTLGTLTYGYGANGQRTSVGGTYARTGLPAALASATYDDANQIATFAETSFTYDDNGNLSSDAERSYTWNARNELTSLTGPVSGSFAYDGLGRRRSKTIGGTTTQFLYDGLNPVQELNGGSPTANLLTGLRIDEYFTRTDAAGVRNFLTDALGSTVALSDGSGTIRTEYSYEPFGGTTTSGNTTDNTFAFTGREGDDTGLYYYRARYYTSHHHRFLSEDPLGQGELGPTLYSYVKDNPVFWRDPTGLQNQPPSGGPPGRPPDGIPGVQNEWVPKGSSGDRPAWGPRDNVPHPKGSQPRATWDSPYGHYDLDDGYGNRTRVKPDGTEAPPHPGQKPPTKPRAKPPWGTWPGLKIPGSPPSPVIVINLCWLEATLPGCYPTIGRGCLM